MAPAPFDPCRQWLGIDAVDLADPRRVLGVSPVERDRQAIFRAAEVRLATLRSVPPGAFDRARDALVQRVEEARDALLAQIGPQAAFKLSMPPPPGGVAAGTPFAAAPPVAVPRVPTVPTVPRPPASGLEPPFAADDDQPGGPGIRIRPAVTYRRSSSGSGVLLLLIAALAAAAGGLYWYKFRPEATARKRAPRAVAQAEPPAAEEAAPAAAPAPPKAPPPRVARPPVRTPAAKEKPPRPPVADDTPAERPDPPTPPPPAPPAPTAEESPQLEKQLRAVAAALREADYDAATAAADAASGVAMTAAGRARAEQWSELVTFARGFADYRNQALATVKAGDEYDVDGKKIGVVEIDDERFVYRFAGKNRTAPRDRIPGGIVMAIVESWFDEKPANDLFVGAYHAAKAEPDLDKARAAWERARARGADASLLLPLLDDPILTAAP